MSRGVTEGGGRSAPRLEDEGESNDDDHDDYTGSDEEGHEGGTMRSSFSGSEEGEEGGLMMMAPEGAPPPPPPPPQSPSSRGEGPPAETGVARCLPPAWKPYAMSEEEWLRRQDQAQEQRAEVARKVRQRMEEEAALDGLVPKSALLKKGKSAGGSSFSRTMKVLMELAGKPDVNGEDEHDEPVGAKDEDAAPILDARDLVYSAADNLKSNPAKRVVRFLYLLVILAVVVLVPGILLFFSTDEVTNSIGDVPSLRIRSDGCDVVLKTGGSAPTAFTATIGTKQAQRLYGDGGSIYPGDHHDMEQWKQDSGEIIVRRGSDPGDPCRVAVTFQAGSVPNVTVVAEGSETTYLTGDDVDFSVGSLALTGNSMVVHMRGLTTGTLDAYLVAGSVNVTRATISESSVVRLGWNDKEGEMCAEPTRASDSNQTVAANETTVVAATNGTVEDDPCDGAGGDLFLSLTTDAWLEYTQASGVFCLAAPAFGVASSSSNSTGYAQLCADPFACGSGGPTIDAAAIDGGLYVHVASVDNSTGYNASVVQGSAFDRGVNLAVTSETTLGQVPSFVEEESGTDYIVLMGLELSGAGVWKFASRLPFLTLEAYWASVFSASFMRPRFMKQSVRLVPAFCPATAEGTPLTIEQYGLVSERLSKIVELSGEQVIGRQVGGRPILDPDTWYDRYILGPTGRWQLRTVGSGQFLAMVCAVFLSLVLAIIGAVGGTYVIIMLAGLLNSSLTRMILTQGMFGEAKRRREVSAAVSGSTAVSWELQVSKPVLPKTKKKHENALLGLFEAAVVAINFLVPASMDSLDLYVRENFFYKSKLSSRAQMEGFVGKINRWIDELRNKPEEQDDDSNDDENADSILLSAFMKRYRTYCCKHGFIERSPVEAVPQAMLEKRFNIVVKTRSVEAHVGVRWRTREDGKRKGGQQSVTDTQQFLDAECVVSGLETDFIPVEEFEARFLAWKGRERMGAGLQPAELKAAGIVYQQKPVRYIQGLKELSTAAKLERMADASYRNNRILFLTFTLLFLGLLGVVCMYVALNRWSSATLIAFIAITASVVVALGVNLHLIAPVLRRERVIWYVEAFMVGLHVAMVVVPPIPVYICTLWMQNEQEEFSGKRPHDYTYGTLSHVEHDPWNLLKKKHHWWTWVIFTYMIFTFAAGFVSLITYYLTGLSFVTWSEVFAPYDRLLDGEIGRRYVSCRDALMVLTGGDVDKLPRTLQFYSPGENARDDQLTKLYREWRMGVRTQAKRLQSSVPRATLLRDHPAVWENPDNPDMTRALTQRRVAADSRILVRARGRAWTPILVLQLVVGNLYPVTLVLTLALYFGYISLVAVWWVLGAVLNPNMMLPYATAAVTTVGFFTLKSRQLFQLRNNVQKVVIDMVTERIVKSLKDSGVMAAMEEVHSVVDTVQNVAENVQDVAEQTVSKAKEMMSSMQADIVGQVDAMLNSVGALLPSDLVEIVKTETDEDDIRATLEEQFASSLNPFAAAIVVSRLMGDTSRTDQKLKETAKQVGNIEPEVVDSLRALVVETASNTPQAAEQFTKSILRAIGKEWENTVDQKLVGSIVNLASTGTRNSFLDLLKHLNRKVGTNLPDSLVNFFGAVLQARANSNSPSIMRDDGVQAALLEFVNYAETVSASQEEGDEEGTPSSAPDVKLHTLMKSLLNALRGDSEEVAVLIDTEVKDGSTSELDRQLVTKSVCQAMVGLVNRKRAPLESSVMDLSKSAEAIAATHTVQNRKPRDMLRLAEKDCEDLGEYLQHLVTLIDTGAVVEEVLTSDIAVVVEPLEKRVSSGQSYFERSEFEAMANQLYNWELENINHTAPAAQGEVAIFKDARGQSNRNRKLTTKLWKDGQCSIEKLLRVMNNDGEEVDKFSTDLAAQIIKLQAKTAASQENDNLTPLADAIKTVLRIVLAKENTEQLIKAQSELKKLFMDGFGSRTAKKREDEDAEKNMNAEDVRQSLMKTSDDNGADTYKQWIEVLRALPGALPPTFLFASADGDGDVLPEMFPAGTRNYYDSPALQDDMFRVYIHQKARVELYKMMMNVDDKRYPDSLKPFADKVDFPQLHELDKARATFGLSLMVVEQTPNEQGLVPDMASALRAFEDKVKSTACSEEGGVLDTLYDDWYSAGSDNAFLLLVSGLWRGDPESISVMTTILKEEFDLNIPCEQGLQVLLRVLSAPVQNPFLVSAAAQESVENMFAVIGISDRKEAARARVLINKAACALFSNQYADALGSCVPSRLKDTLHKWNVNTKALNAIVKDAYAQQHLTSEDGEVDSADKGSGIAVLVRSLLHTAHVLSAADSKQTKKVTAASSALQHVGGALFAHTRRYVARKLDVIADDGSLDMLTGVCGQALKTQKLTAMAAHVMSTMTAVNALIDMSKDLMKVTHMDAQQSSEGTGMLPMLDYLRNEVDTLMSEDTTEERIRRHTIRSGTMVSASSKWSDLPRDAPSNMLDDSDSTVWLSGPTDEDIFIDIALATPAKLKKLRVLWGPDPNHARTPKVVYLYVSDSQMVEGRPDIYTRPLCVFGKRDKSGGYVAVPSAYEDMLKAAQNAGGAVAKAVEKARENVRHVKLLLRGFPAGARAQCIQSIEILSEASVADAELSSFSHVLRLTGADRENFTVDSMELLQSMHLLYGTAGENKAAMLRRLFGKGRGVGVSEDDSTAAFACLMDTAIQANPGNDVLPVDNFDGAKIRALASYVCRADQLTAHPSTVASFMLLLKAIAVRSTALNNVPRGTRSLVKVDEGLLSSQQTKELSSVQAHLEDALLSLGDALEVNSQRLRGLMAFAFGKSDVRGIMDIDRFATGVNVPPKVAAAVVALATRNPDLMSRAFPVLAKCVQHNDPGAIVRLVQMMDSWTERLVEGAQSMAQRFGIPSQGMRVLLDSKLPVRFISSSGKLPESFTHKGFLSVPAAEVASVLVPLASGMHTVLSGAASMPHQERIIDQLHGITNYEELDLIKHLLASMHFRRPSQLIDAMCAQMTKMIRKYISIVLDNTSMSDSEALSRLEDSVNPEKHRDLVTMLLTQNKAVDHIAAKNALLPIGDEHNPGVVDLLVDGFARSTRDAVNEIKGELSEQYSDNVDLKKAKCDQILRKCNEWLISKKPIERRMAVVHTIADKLSEFKSANSTEMAAYQLENSARLWTDVVVALEGDRARQGGSAFTEKMLESVHEFSRQTAMGELNAAAEATVIPSSSMDLQSKSAKEEKAKKDKAKEDKAKEGKPEEDEPKEGESKPEKKGGHNLMSGLENAEGNTGKKALERAEKPANDASELGKNAVEDYKIPDSTWEAITTRLVIRQDGKQDQIMWLTSTLPALSSGLLLSQRQDYERRVNAKSTDLIFWDGCFKKNGDRTTYKAFFHTMLCDTPTYDPAGAGDDADDKFAKRPSLTLNSKKERMKLIFQFPVFEAEKQEALETKIQLLKTVLTNLHEHIYKRCEGKQQDTLAVKLALNSMEQGKRPLRKEGTFKVLITEVLKSYVGVIGGQGLDDEGLTSIAMQCGDKDVKLFFHSDMSKRLMVTLVKLAQPTNAEDSVLDALSEGLTPFCREIAGLEGDDIKRMVAVCLLCKGDPAALKSPFLLKHITGTRDEDDLKVQHSRAFFTLIRSFELNNRAATLRQEAKLVQPLNFVLGFKRPEALQILVRVLHGDDRAAQALLQWMPGVSLALTPGKDGTPWNAAKEMFLGCLQDIDSLGLPDSDDTPSASQQSVNRFALLLRALTDSEWLSHSDNRVNVYQALVNMAKGLQMTWSVNVSGLSAEPILGPVLHSLLAFSVYNDEEQICRTIPAVLSTMFPPVNAVETQMVVDVSFSANTRRLNAIKCLPDSVPNAVTKIATTLCGDNSYDDDASVSWPDKRSAPFSAVVNINSLEFDVSAAAEKAANELIDMLTESHCDKPYDPVLIKPVFLRYGDKVYVVKRNDDAAHAMYTIFKSILDDFKKQRDMGMVSCLPSAAKQESSTRKAPAAVSFFEKVISAHKTGMDTLYASVFATKDSERAVLHKLSCDRAAETDTTVIGDNVVTRNDLVLEYANPMNEPELGSVRRLLRDLLKFPLDSPYASAAIVRFASTCIATTHSKLGADKHIAATHPISRVAESFASTAFAFHAVATDNLSALLNNADVEYVLEELCRDSCMVVRSLKKEISDIVKTGNITDNRHELSKLAKRLDEERSGALMRRSVHFTKSDKPRLEGLLALLRGVKAGNFISLTGWYMPSGITTIALDSSVNMNLIRDMTITSLGAFSYFQDVPAYKDKDESTVDIKLQPAFDTTYLESSGISLPDKSPLKSAFMDVFGMLGFNTDMQQKYEFFWSEPPMLVFSSMIVDHLLRAYSPSGDVYEHFKVLDEKENKVPQPPEGEDTDDGEFKLQKDLDLEKPGQVDAMNAAIHAVSEWMEVLGLFQSMVSDWLEGEETRLRMHGCVSSIDAPLKFKSDSPLFDEFELLEYKCTRLYKCISADEEDEEDDFTSDDEPRKVLLPHLHKLRAMLIRFTQEGTEGAFKTEAFTDELIHTTAIVRKFQELGVKREIDRVVSQTFKCHPKEIGTEISREMKRDLVGTDDTTNPKMGLLQALVSFAAHRTEAMDMVDFGAVGSKNGYVDDVFNCDEDVCTGLIGVFEASRLESGLKQQSNQNDRMDKGYTERQKMLSDIGAGLTRHLDLLGFGPERALVNSERDLMKLTNLLRQQSGMECADVVMRLLRKVMTRFVPHLDPVLPLLSIAPRLGASTTVPFSLIGNENHRKESMLSFLAEDFEGEQAPKPPLHEPLPQLMSEAQVLEEIWKECVIFSKGSDAPTKNTTVLPADLQATLLRRGVRLSEQRLTALIEDLDGTVGQVNEQFELDEKMFKRVVTQVDLQLGRGLMLGKFFAAKMSEKMTPLMMPKMFPSAATAGIARPDTLGDRDLYKLYETVMKLKIGKEEMAAVHSSIAVLHSAFLSDLRELVSGARSLPQLLHKLMHLTDAQMGYLNAESVRDATTLFTQCVQLLVAVQEERNAEVFEISRFLLHVFDTKSGGGGNVFDKAIDIYYKDYYKRDKPLDTDRLWDDNVIALNKLTNEIYEFKFETKQMFEKVDEQQPMKSAITSGTREKLTKEQFALGFRLRLMLHPLKNTEELRKTAKMFIEMLLMINSLKSLSSGEDPVHKEFQSAFDETDMNIEGTTLRLTYEQFESAVQKLTENKYLESADEVQMRAAFKRYAVAFKLDESIESGLDEAQFRRACMMIMQHSRRNASKSDEEIVNAFKYATNEVDEIAGQTRKITEHSQLTGAIEKLVENKVLSFDKLKQTSPPEAGPEELLAQMVKLAAKEVGVEKGGQYTFDVDKQAFTKMVNALQRKYRHKDAPDLMPQNEKTAALNRTVGIFLQNVFRLLKNNRWVRPSNMERGSPGMVAYEIFGALYEAWVSWRHHYGPDIDKVQGLDCPLKTEDGNDIYKLDKKHRGDVLFAPKSKADGEGIKVPASESSDLKVVLMGALIGKPARNALDSVLDNFAGSKFLVGPMLHGPNAGDVVQARRAAGLMIDFFEKGKEPLDKRFGQLCQTLANAQIGDYVASSSWLTDMLKQESAGRQVAQSVKLLEDVVLVQTGSSSLRTGNAASRSQELTKLIKKWCDQTNQPNLTEPIVLLLQGNIQEAFKLLMSLQLLAVDQAGPFGGLWGKAAHGKRIRFEATVDAAKSPDRWLVGATSAYLGTLMEKRNAGSSIQMKRGVQSFLHGLPDKALEGPVKPPEGRQEEVRVLFNLLVDAALELRSEPGVLVRTSGAASADSTSVEALEQLISHLPVSTAARSVMKLLLVVARGERSDPSELISASIAMTDLVGGARDANLTSEEAQLVLERFYHHAASMLSRRQAAIEERREMKARLASVDSFAAATETLSDAAEDIFKKYDSDGSGRMNFNEFYEMTRRMKLNLTEDRALAIFSRVDVNGNDELDVEEFQVTLTILKLEVAHMTLNRLGMSDAMLLTFLVYWMVVLVLLFLFVFLGINAFTTGTAFGSVINSTLCAGVGGVVGNASDKEKEEGASMEDTVSSSVQSAFDQLADIASE